MTTVEDVSAAAATSRRSARRVALGGWAVAVTVYLTAVLHRTSLGVAGLQAADRFHLSAGQLSGFVLLQLGVYAMMQIPTGVLVDRYGPRRLLVAAALIMAAAQTLFALAPGYPTALLARAVLGCGDALTFVSVLRFTAQHFSARRYPLVVGATGMLGAAGNVVATAPLSAMLQSVGWVPTFLGAAATSALAGCAVWWMLPPSSPVPGGPRTPGDLSDALRRVRGRISDAWATPGTRVGFWVHFASMSTCLSFAVLWGQPYLVAQGYSRGAASSVLLVAAAVTIVASPVVGLVVGRSPAARVPLAITVCAVTVLGWAVLLAGFGGRPPTVLLIAVVAWTALGGPASSVAFGLARDYNRGSVVGTASGVVNVGGFLAAIVWSVTIGLVLDGLGGTDVAAFRSAFAVGVAIQLAATVQVVRWWLTARANALRARDRGEQIPVHLVRHRWDLVG